ncbi:MAG: DUF2141 domain-containing protein [bacterium]
MIKLKNLILTLLFLPVMSTFLFSQHNLIIEINDLRNNNGQLLLEFSNAKGDKIMGIAQNIIDNKCIVVIKNLKPGKYAFKYFHDENKNDNLDLNWMGIPKEGYGFSNNAKGLFGPPSFNKTIFVIKGAATQKCTPEYF